MLALGERCEKNKPGCKSLCGAGISTGDDVAAAIELGRKAASCIRVIKAKDPKAALFDLVKKI